MPRHGICRCSFLSFLLVCLVAIVVWPVSAQAAPPPKPQTVGKLLSRGYVELPFLGKKIVREKRILADKWVFEVAYNESGKTVNADAMVSDEALMASLLRGRATRELFAAITAQSPATPLPVIVWSADALPDVDKSLVDPAAANTQVQAHAAALASARLQLTNLLSSLGVNAEPLVPVPAVRATVLPSVALSLAFRPEVARIGLDPRPAIPTRVTPVDTTGARQVHLLGF